MGTGAEETSNADNDISKPVSTEQFDSQLTTNITSEMAHSVSDANRERSNETVFPPFTPLISGQLPEIGTEKPEMQAWNAEVDVLFQ